MSASKKMRATSLHVSPRNTGRRFFLDESERPLLSSRKPQNSEDANHRLSTIFRFFKSMTEGKFQEKSGLPSNMPFNLFISSFRRKRIMDALMGKQGSLKKRKGEQILKVSDEWE